MGVGGGVEAWRGGLGAAGRRLLMRGAGGWVVGGSRLLPRLQRPAAAAYAAREPPPSRTQRGRGGELRGRREQRDQQHRLQEGAVQAAADAGLLEQGVRRHGVVPARGRLRQWKCLGRGAWVGGGLARRPSARCRRPASAKRRASRLQGVTPCHFHHSPRVARRSPRISRLVGVVLQQRRDQPQRRQPVRDGQAAEEGEGVEERPQRRRKAGEVAKDWRLHLARWGEAREGGRLWRQLVVRGCLRPRRAPRLGLPVGALNLEPPSLSPGPPPPTQPPTSRPSGEKKPDFSKVASGSAPPSAPLSSRPSRWRMLE
jgi:hypothetical protein